MPPILTVASTSFPLWCRRRLIGDFHLYRYVLLLWLLCSAPAWAAPVILNYPLTALSGSVIGVSGSGFGSSPSIYFGTNLHPNPIPVKVLKADNNFVAFEVPPNMGFDLYKFAISDGANWSSIVYTNYPRGMQFDRPEIASNDTFRIFGHNLYVSPLSPSVTLVDQSSGARLTASVNLSQSDAYSLTVTAPAGIVPGHSYMALISNGAGSYYSDVCILGRSGGGTDYFQLGVPWGRDYIYQNGPNYNGTVDNSDHHVYDVTSDPFVSPHAMGNGINDDQPAIQAAINLASRHGGLVYLPAGTYRLGSPSGSGVWMASNVVIQGHSANDTTILFGPASQQPSSYTFWGFYWQPNATLSGLADLSIKNVDTLSQSVRNLVTAGANSKLFLARVNWNLNTGWFLNPTNSDRLVVTNSSFQSAINTQMPAADSPQDSGVAPIWFDHITNFIFKNNNVLFYSGANAFLTLNSAVIEGNSFTRNASDKILVTAANISWLNGDQDAPIQIGDYVNHRVSHVIAEEFAKNIVIQNNTFNVTGGVLTKNMNDGETINSEGGAYLDLQDVGTVTSATSTSVSSSTKNWNYVPASVFNAGSKIAILSGQGAGQWRQIVSMNGNNTFNIDSPWSIVPSPGDNFTIFVPSMENGLIRNNVMSGNTHGILLFAAGFYNVSVLNNTLTNNGGIWLDSIQDTNGLSFASPKIGILRNIEVNGNTVTNTNGYLPAYIVARDGIEDVNTIWGRAMDGIEMRNNSVTGYPGTPLFDFPDGIYLNRVVYADGNAPFSPNGPAPGYGILGTIFQGNNCTNCPVFYGLGTGVDDTIIWNSSINGAAATGGLTPIVQDQLIWNTAPQASTGTVIGHD